MLRLATTSLFLLASVALAAEPEGDLKVLQGVWVIEEMLSQRGNDKCQP